MIPGPTILSASDNKLSHLEALRDDARDEVKRRIQQRDQYSMQLTVALGALAVGAFSANGTPRLFIIAPLVSIYFTRLILYSYRIHDVLVAYLHDEIEPQFSTLCDVPTRIEWETWYQARGRKPGLRRSFFVLEMWMVTVLTLLFLWHKERLWSTVFADVSAVVMASIPGVVSDWFSSVLLVTTLLYIPLVVQTSLLARKEASR